MSSFWRIFGMACASVLLLGASRSEAASAGSSSAGCVDAMPLDAIRQRFQAVRIADEAAVPGRGRYRLLTLERDRIHDRAWAVIEDCRRPDIPWMALAVILPDGFNAADGAGSPAAPVPATAAGWASRWQVQGGDRVHLWSAGSVVRVDLQAIALGPGRIGDRIALRFAGVSGRDVVGWGAGWADGSPAIAHGIVRGPGSVELERGAGWNAGSTGGRKNAE